jgi:hypothetical protein
VSRRPLVAGVTRVEALADLDSCDLLMSCHLLEHLSDPLHEIVSYEKARYLYLEVPFGVPQASRLRDAATQGAKLLSGSRFAWRLLTEAAAGRASAPWTQPLRMSEHQNFFTHAGLRRIAERAGRSVMALDEVEIAAPDGGRIKVLRVLAE